MGEERLVYTAWRYGIFIFVHKLMV